MQSLAPAAILDLAMLLISVYLCIRTLLTPSCAGLHWVVETSGLPERCKDLGHQQRGGV